MSTLAAEYKLSQYQTIHSLDEKGNVELVNDMDKGRFVVKKTHSNYNIQVYESLIKNPHPNVVHHYDSFLHENQLITIEEFMNGITLEEVLEKNGPLGEEEVCEILLQICSALKHLHHLREPIIHRDIKLTNIMMDSNKHIKLIDFNIARLYDSVQSNDTVILGTAGFAAPEQFGFQQTDARSDIYAIGVLLNYLLVGVSPQEQLYKGRLGAVISRCIQIDPEKRYQSIQQLETDIMKSKTGPKRKGFFYYYIFVMRCAICIAGFSTCITNLASPSKTTFPLSIFENFVFLSCTLFAVAVSSNFMNIFKYLPLCSSEKNSVKVFGYFFYVAVAFFIRSTMLDIIYSIDTWMKM